MSGNQENPAKPCARLRIELSGLEPWLETLCCGLGERYFRSDGFLKINELSWNKTAAREWRDSLTCRLVQAYMLPNHQPVHWHRYTQCSGDHYRWKSAQGEVGRKICCLQSNRGASWVQNLQREEGSQKKEEEDTRWLGQKCIEMKNWIQIKWDWNKTADFNKKMNITGTWLFCLAPLTQEDYQGWKVFYRLALTAVSWFAVNFLSVMSHTVSALLRRRWIITGPHSHPYTNPTRFGASAPGWPLAPVSIDLKMRQKCGYMY